MPTNLPTFPPERRILSILAVAFFFIAQSQALYLTGGMERLPPLYTGLAALTHYGGMAAFSFFLPRLMKRGKGMDPPTLFAPVPLLVLGCAAALFCSHVFIAGNYVLVVLLGRSLGMGLFLAAALHVFFLSVRECRGFFLGLAFSAGELIWLVVLPGMNAALPASSDMVLFEHVHKIQAVFQAVTGVLIASAMVCRAAPAGDFRDAESGNVSAINANVSAGADVLPALLVAGALLYILFGFAFQQPFPKIELRLNSQDNLHIALLFSAPLAGLALDRGRARLLLVFLACVSVVGPAALLVRHEFLQGILYGIFCVGRQVFFLVGLVLAGRLVHGGSRRLLLCCLLYALQSLALVGLALSRVAVAGALPIALVLAVGVLLFLGRVRRGLFRMPETAAEKQPPDVPVGDFFSPPQTGIALETSPPFASGPPSEAVPQLGPDRVSDAPSFAFLLSAHARLASPTAAFAHEHGLSEQEERVMALLAEGRSTDAIAESMGCKTATIRTYVHRLFKKTGTASRRELVSALADYIAGGSARNAEAGARARK